MVEQDHQWMLPSEQTFAKSKTTSFIPPVIFRHSYLLPFAFMLHHGTKYKPSSIPRY